MTDRSFESGALNAAMGRLFNDLSHPEMIGGLSIAGATIHGYVTTISAWLAGSDAVAAGRAGAVGLVAWVALHSDEIGAEEAPTTSNDGQSNDEIKFSNESKLRDQMKQRGWTEDQILEAMKTEGIPAQGKKGPATRYVHPESGKSVVKDNASGEVFHIGGENYLYD